MHCAIRGRMLFVELDVQKAEEQLCTVTNHIYKAGDIIYRLGEEPKAIYSLRKGMVKLTLVSPEGEERIVRLLGPGAVIGLETQLEQAYEHTAQCISAVDVCRIPAPSLRQLLHDQPVLYEALLQRWHEHTELADRHILNLTAGSIKGRVVHLLELLDEISRMSNSPLQLPPNHDCATIIGARIESVSRVMAEFKRAGALEHHPDGGWLFQSELVPADT